MHPIARLNKGNEKKIQTGYPWVFADEIGDTAELLTGEPGMLVELKSYRDEFLGIGYFNRFSKIAIRLLTTKKEIIDQAFFARRFEAARTKREKKITAPYYRLVHSESDGLPGLVIDRFGYTFVCQVTTAGMERLQPLWLAALEELFAPATIVFRNDVPARTQEKLPQEVRVVKGTVDGLVRVQEYDRLYLADLIKGQKTGWFYDQRDNRQLVAELAKGKTLLDVYCHSGGFGIAAARAGASGVTFVDSSDWALDMAKGAAELNGVAEFCSYLQGNAFELMESLGKEQKTFNIVVADPPAFIPSKKDLARGLKGYEKVAKLATPLVAKSGHLFIASCSHHATPSLFRKSVMAGISRAGRKATLIKQTGAASDHPVHPQLPQSEYLKGLLLKLN